MHGDNRVTINTDLFSGQDSPAVGCLPDIALPRELPQQPIGIAEMADFFGVTHRTLHFYEEKELLKAKRIGPMRTYSHADAARMAVINACREVGMPVSVIQELMRELATTTTGAEANGIFRTAMTTRKRELTADLSTIHRQVQQINDLLSNERNALNGADTPANIGLSSMEHKCLELMAEGYTQNRLAQALDIDAFEAQRLETDIIRKFSANNRFQAVAKAALLGLVTA